MSSTMPSNVDIARELGALKSRLSAVELDLAAWRAAEDPVPSVSRDPVDFRYSEEEVGDMIDERIQQHLQDAELQIDRVRDLHARLRSVERAIAEQEEGRLIGELPRRDVAPPRPHAPVDYTPVITAAIQMMRDIGVCLLERQREKPAPPPPAGGKTR